MALFFIGCQQKILTKTDHPEDADSVQFDIAEKYRQNGYLDKALEAYLVYLERFPAGKKSSLVISQIARLYSQKGQYGKALALYESISETKPDCFDMSTVKYEVARHLYLTEDYRGSIEKGLQWFDEYPESLLKEDVMLLLVDDFMALGQGAQAFDWWLRVDKEVIDNPQKQTHLISRLEKLAMACDTKDKSRPFYEESQEAWISLARKKLDQIKRERTDVNPGVIGCLLPLSGPFAVYGEEVLNGIELGADLFTESGDNISFELDIRDTEGDPERTIAELEDLVYSGKVIALIGPLSSKTAFLAGRKAQELGVPIITLTQKEGIEETGEMVFRNFITPSQEVRKLLDISINRLGIQKFAILYPQSSYGSFFMNCFWDIMEEMGGIVTAVESYDSTATDFADPIKKMTGMYYPRSDVLDQDNSKAEGVGSDSMNMESETDEPEEPEPIVDFDAVFIPDNYNTVAMIAPSLVYHDVKDVLLIGTSLWQSQHLVDLAGEYVQGAVFTSGFFGGYDVGPVHDFVQDYKTSFDKNPGVLAAYGFDTIRVLKKVIAEKNVITRSDLQRELSEYRGFVGITGPISFDPQEKTAPLLLTIAGRRIIPFD
jgi:ABC-type branched-subunit amino acid transport system substrate-binding protein